jgi:hypothetical protein
MPMPTPAQRKRREIFGGICLVAGGIWMGYLSLDSFRTGIPVPGTREHNYPMQWWEVVPIGILLVFFGFLMIGGGLGLIKTKGER